MLAFAEPGVCPLEAPLSARTQQQGEPSPCSEWSAAEWGTAWEPAWGARGSRPLSLPAQLRAAGSGRAARALTCCTDAPTRSAAGSPPGRRCSGTCWAGCLRRKAQEAEVGARPPALAPPRGGVLTSVGAEEGVVCDGPRLGEGVELVEPLPGHVEPQQAGLPQGGQGHHLLPLPHGLLAALPGAGGGPAAVPGRSRGTSQAPASRTQRPGPLGDPSASQPPPGSWPRGLRGDPTPASGFPSPSQRLFLKNVNLRPGPQHLPGSALPPREASVQPGGRRPRPARPHLPGPHL